MKTVKSWHFEILKFWDFEILKFWNCKTSKLWNFESLKLWDFEIWKFPNVAIKKNEICQWLICVFVILLFLYVCYGFFVLMVELLKVRNVGIFKFINFRLIKQHRCGLKFISGISKFRKFDIWSFVLVVHFFFLFWCF